ncbi:hypothetical protein PACTADRAFT_32866 [Pachysolen tannophilus NRRL Y-2460]|uniref:Regulator of rDNA transcription 14 n=1 Tax=Pachysolen tannophilus NRRL Y-2460 TaxID=669874 RepID=A0A1E4U082_PACTA|nr:hypothetical protein PACTADRAFT_32866 [Pachysolen tannophilus NRRL Y-2460]
MFSGSFRSESSKLQSQNAINKLISNYLPGSEQIASSNSSKKLNKIKLIKSGAQAINNNAVNHKFNEKNEAFRRKSQKKEKLVKRKKVKSISEETLKLNRVAKINKLKSEKNYKDKELVEVLDKKVEILKSWELSNENELKALEAEILSIKQKEQNKRKKTRARRQEKSEFNEKVKKGIISYPGLTPGLAPVGLADEDEDEESDY